ncbi:hypothetical protein ABK040_015239 [Willaertia magna]
MLCFDRSGALNTFGTIPPEYKWMDYVLPLMDESFNYYTVRMNASNNVNFILRTDLYAKTNQVLFDTKTNNNINAMIITEYGLIISSGNFLACVDKNKGTGKWVVALNGLEYGCQFLYDTTGPTAVLYVLVTNRLFAVNPQNGMVMTSTPIIRINLNNRLPLLTVGKDYLAIPDQVFNSVIHVVDKRNLEKGIIATARVPTEESPMDFSRCSNVISRDLTNSFFIVCKKTDNSYSAYRFDVTNSTVTLAFGKSGFYGMACDVGLIGFHQDNFIVPRREIYAEVTADTQVYGTLGRFALITTSVNGKTVVEYVAVDN